MESSFKLKVNNSEDIRHQVYIVDVPLSSLKKKRNRYRLKIKKKYTYQKAVVKAMLDSSIIQNKQNIIGDYFDIRFDDNKINIFLEKQVKDKTSLKKWADTG